MQSLKSRPVSYPVVDSEAGALIFKQLVFVKYDTYVLSTWSCERNEGSFRKIYFQYCPTSSFSGIKINVQLAMRRTCVSLAIESTLQVR